MRFISRVEEDAGLRYPGHERAVGFAGARLAALGALRHAVSISARRICSFRMTVSRICSAKDLSIDHGDDGRRAS